MELYRRAEIEAVVERALSNKKSSKGLRVMLGYQPLAAETARQWLDKFHDDSLMQIRPLQSSFIPEESAVVKKLE